MFKHFTAFVKDTLKALKTTTPLFLRGIEKNTKLFGDGTATMGVESESEDELDVKHGTKMF